jgi:hypothetical protein
MAGMTAKQQRFVTEYLIDLNATQAAIRAGYSARTAGKIGYQLLEKTGIQAAIETGHRAHRERAGVTRDSMAQQFDDDREFAREHAQPAAAVSASTAKAKMFGLFVDRRLLGVRNIDNMSEEELLEFLGGEPEAEELGAAESHHAPGHA